MREIRYRNWLILFSLTGLSLILHVSEAFNRGGIEATQLPDAALLYTLSKLRLITTLLSKWATLGRGPAMWITYV